MEESNSFDGGAGALVKMAAKRAANMATKMAKNVNVADLKKQGKDFVKKGMNNMKSNVAEGVKNAKTGMMDSAKNAQSSMMEKANSAKTSMMDSAKSVKNSVSNVKTADISKAASDLSVRFGVNGQHPLIYILGFNFILRVILLFSLSIKPKAKDKVHLEHSKSSLGVSLASICIAGYIHYVNANAANAANADNQGVYNEQLGALLFILLYIVILYDVLLPLFQKHKGKGKVAKEGSLAGLIMLPGFLLVLMFFVSKEVDSKMSLAVKILNDNSMLTLFFTFAAAVIISIVSFFLLFTQEIANKRKKSAEEQVKLMKAYYIMLMIAVFILALVIEYTLG